MKRFLLGAILASAMAGGASASSVLYNVEYTLGSSVSYQGQYTGEVHTFNIATEEDATEAEFHAWCANLFKPYKDGASYIDGTDMLAGYKFSRLNSLINAAYGGVDLGNADHVAGFQLAIWESLHEKQGTELNILTDSIYYRNVDSNSVKPDRPLIYAAQYLKAAAGWDGIEKYSWMFYSSPDSQDLLRVTGAVAAVPLPASGLLALGGIAALGAVGRRRKALRKAA